MGDPRSEENCTDNIIDPYESVCDKNQNKLKERRVMVWERTKQDFVSNHPEEKSGNNITRFSLNGHESGNLCGMPGPSPSLLAALRSLADHSDHMLLPHSLHQIAEAYFLKEDYPWAVQFLRLERLYHERLLSNLASLQEEWECQGKAGAQSSATVKTHSSNAESNYVDSLSHICRTHQRPHRTKEKDLVDLTQQSGLWEGTEERKTVQQMTCGSSVEEKEIMEGVELEVDDGEEEEILEDEGSVLEVHEETEKEAKLEQLDATFPSNGPVSILKKRGCLEETDFANSSPIKCSYRRKVHFSESDDAFDNEEVSGASCVMFLLLCLLTVLISMGGTALYCILGGAYSNICADFSHNMEFYFGPVRRGVDTLTHWFASKS